MSNGALSSPGDLYLLHDMLPAGVIDEDELAAAVDTIVSEQRMKKVITLSFLVTVTPCTALGKQRLTEAMS
jgi:hypothetical protein